jgi:rhamnose transport system permease protein
MRRYQRELSVALAYLFLLGILWLVAPRFYQSNELRNILVYSAPVLVAVVGMTLVILARHIDISIGLQVTVCGVIAGFLAKAGLPMPLVVMATIVCGAMFGAVNGALVAGLGLPSIVVTLATLFILREGLRWACSGEAIRNLPPTFQWFGLGQAAGQTLIVAIALVVFVVFAWGLRQMSFGRAIYATGSDADAAWLVGIRPQQVVFCTFTLMGALAGLAALLSIVRFPTVQTTAQMGMEMQVIAAVVVGGVAVSGGRGTLVGPLLGVALLGTIGSALVFLHVENQWSRAIEGAIILIAVTADAIQFKRKKNVSTRLATA